MKLKCLNCGHKFEGRISLDELGWHSYCNECDSSFDVDIPQGRIIMAFTDPDCDLDNPYDTFTDDFTGENVNICFAFDTPKAFIRKWKRIVNEKEGPYGMWYWVLDNNEIICSGACDPGDIDIFEDYFGEEI